MVPGVTPLSDTTTMTEEPPPGELRKKASLRQVAATMFWGLFMIGKKGTWERDGATVTLAQVVVGGVVTCAIVVFILIALTRFAVS